MTDTKDKVRSVALTTLLLLSVFGGAVAFAGTVSAATNFSTTADSNGSITGSGVSPNTVSKSARNTYTVSFNVDNLAADGNTDSFYVEVPTSEGWKLDTAASSASFEAVDGGGIGSVSSPSTTDRDGDGNKEVKVTISPERNDELVDIDAQFKVVATSPSRDARFYFNAHIIDSNGDDLINQRVGAVQVGALKIRDYDEVFSTPATVFLGEKGVDLSDVYGSGSQSLRGVAGNADGSVVIIDDPSSVDFTNSTGFDTGGYDDEDADENVDLSVRTPQISKVTLYSGSGTAGADVTNGMVIESTSRVTVKPVFNFDTADKLEVTITDSEGLEVTNKLLSDVENPNVAKISGSWYYFGTSGSHFELDVSNLDQERYNVTLEGTELDSASQQVHFTVGHADTSISLDKSSVVQGEMVIATVTGAPGETNYVRIAESDLDNPSVSATNVFDNTDDVTNRSRVTVGTTTYVFAALSLGDDRRAKVRIQSLALDTGTAEIQAVDSKKDAEADSEVDLTVTEPKVTITSSPDTVAVDEEFSMNGTAPGVDNIRAFVKVNNAWYPIPGDDSGGVDVGSNGKWTLELHASGNLSIPGQYRIGVVGYANGETYRETPIENLKKVPNTAWGDELSTTASTSIQTFEGNLTATLSRTDVAAIGSDEVTITGKAIGQGEVDVYIIGPRGQVRTHNISLDNNQFSKDLSGFTQRGEYQIIIVGNGRDNNYDGTSTSPSQLATFSSSNTQKQNVEIILDYHQGAGIDDTISRVNLTASAANIQITSGARLPQQQNITITGTSNREPGTVIFVEIVDQNGTTFVSNQAAITVNGTWRVQFDLSDVKTGKYTLRAEGDEASASMTVHIVNQLTTKTPIPNGTATATATSTKTVTSTPTKTPTETETPIETTTPSSGPGFSVTVLLVALLGAALLTLRSCD